MKLNYRDKIILTVAIVAVVWVIGVMFFIKPAIEKISDTQTKLDDAKTTLSEVQAQVNQDKDLPQKIDETYSQASKLATNFYMRPAYDKTQDATQRVDDLLDAHKLVNEDITINSYVPGKLSPYYVGPYMNQTEMDAIVDAYNEAGVYTEEELQEIAANSGIVLDQNGEPLVDEVVGSYTITYNFYGPLDQVKQFCHDLTTNNEKTLLVNSINFPLQLRDLEPGEELDEDDDPYEYKYMMLNAEGEPEEVESEYPVVKGSMNVQMIVIKELKDPNTIVAPTDADAS